jgi:glucose-6-phosphate 1-dehydrogenase
MNKPLNGLTTEPAILTVFGITGDLSQRKLLPALYHLIKDNLLHEQTHIVGVSRQNMSVDELLSNVELCVLEQDNVCDPDALKRLRDALSMVQLDPENSADYVHLKHELDEIESRYGTCMNRLFYLSIPPKIFVPVVQNLGEQGLNKGCQHNTAVSRLLIEKPFGHDLKNAQELISKTAEYFDEAQIFRIDHYLAKESVQNVLTFRHHNPVFSDSWNGKYITNIQVTAHEKIGVEGRGGFYDDVGALRDLVQSHLLQLLALVLVDITHTDEDAALHNAKQVVLESLQATHLEQSVRGQYEGYAQEVENDNSMTETFVRLHLSSSLENWAGTNITIETGKALAEKRTEIVLTYADDAGSTNDLTFRIQPNEGIDLTITAKKPGFEHALQHVTMDFSYNGAFDEPSHPDAYERVLVDAARGDHSLFATSNEVIASWQALQPLLDYWTTNTDIKPYTSGSGGPL